MKYTFKECVKKPKINYTVEPRFNKVLRDWGKLVRYIEDSLYRKPRFNPLTPNSDWHLISPYHINPELNIKVRRIKELITN